MRTDEAFRVSGLWLNVCVHESFDVKAVMGINRWIY